MKKGEPKPDSGGCGTTDCHLSDCWGGLSPGRELSQTYTTHNAEAEAPKLWLPDANSQLIGKDPDAGKE